LTSAALDLQRMGWELGARESSVRVLDLQQVLTVVDESFLGMVRRADVLISFLGSVDLEREIPPLRAAVAQFRGAQRGRWAFGAFIDESVLHNELMADYRDVERIATRYATRLSGTDRVQLINENGTDLTFRMGGRPIHIDTGILTTPGAFGNLPAGEVFVAPLETSAHGTLVVDLAIADLVMDGPVTLQFHGGRVIAVEGGAAALLLERRLAADPSATVLGEFGIGANPYARIRGRVTTDEKVLGTIHIALGSNHQFGGLQVSDHHYDCVTTLPRILLDGEEWRN
jgi:leucyl aminopeptidase (aminopeptidase T)